MGFFRRHNDYWQGKALESLFNKRISDLENQVSNLSFMVKQPPLFNIGNIVVKKNRMVQMVEDNPDKYLVMHFIINNCIEGNINLVTTTKSYRYKTVDMKTGREITFSENEIELFPTPE